MKQACSLLVRWIRLVNKNYAKLSLLSNVALWPTTTETHRHTMNGNATLHTQTTTTQTQQDAYTDTHHTHTPAPPPPPHHHTHYTQNHFVLELEMTITQMFLSWSTWDVCAYWAHLKTTASLFNTISSPACVFCTNLSSMGTSLTQIKK